MLKQVKENIIPRLKLNRKPVLAAAGLALVAVIAWWQISLSSAGTPVKTATVVRGDIEIFVSAPSKVTLPSRANLNFITGGRIAGIYVKPGDEVVAGEILAELDMASIYPQIDQADAGLKIAQAGLDRLLSGRSRREIAVAEASVGQASAAVENARRSLKTVEKLIAQGKQKANLNAKSAEAGLNIANQQLSKLKKGPRFEESVLARSQLDQALQAVSDASANYSKVSSLNNETLNEADQAVNSAQAVLDAYVAEKEDTSSATYFQLKASYNAATAAKNRAIAQSNQSLQAAQTQLNSANRAYDIALAQYDLATAPARSEDLTIMNNQLRQAEISLEIAKIGINDAGLDAQLDAAQAQLDNAIKSSQVAIAQLELQKEGPRAADVQTAKGQIEQAKAALASAEAIAGDALLRAPFSGRVAAVNGKVGEIAGLSSAGAGSGVGALITLVNFDRIELSADVDETEVGKLKTGQNVRVAIDAYEDRIFDGKLTDVSLISSKNSTGGIVFGVTIIVNPGKDEFREGMSGDVDIIVDGKNSVLTIPFEAVKADGKKNTVYVIEDGYARMREIKIGLSSDTAYEVISGLKEGEVVATGKVALTNGQRVKAEKDGRIGQ